MSKFSVHDVIFEGGDWTTLDRRYADYRQAPRAPADDENGTEQHAQTWARDFYVLNEAFLCAFIKTREALAYFFETWYSSVYADCTRANVPLRSFDQILFALQDGGLLCLRDRTVVWHKARKVGPTLA